MRNKIILLFILVFQMTGGWKRSPSSQPSSKAGGSSEDLLSDSASVASDVSDTSANSSLLGKRTIAPPAKVSTPCFTQFPSMTFQWSFKPQWVKATCQWWPQCFYRSQEG